MRKVILGAAALSLLALASCKKDYTCECTTTDGSGNSASVSTTINDTKKNAEESCESGSTSSQGYTTTCEIK